MPFFSVIMPLYNKEAFLVEAIDSVLEQTFGDFELIVVNDCSTDGSLDLVKKYIDQRIKIINNPLNIKLSATRNVGIHAASGTFVAFLDADDKWETSFLSEVYKNTLQFPKAEVFAAAYYKWNGYSKKLPDTKLNRIKQTTFVHNFFQLAIGPSPYCSSSFAVKTSLIKEVGGYNERITFGEDIDLILKLLTKRDLVFDPKPLAYYRQSVPNQMTAWRISKKMHPDFEYYNYLTDSIIGLKQYLHFHRYTMLMAAVAEGNKAIAQKYRSQLVVSQLNRKRKLLSISPAWLVRILFRMRSLMR